MRDEIEIIELASLRSEAAIEQLASILHDCVSHGASVSFMWPFEIEDARGYWRGVLDPLSRGRLRLFAACRDGMVKGTVQLDLAGPCNQNHRADVRKLLVHTSARRQGIARRLMQHAEAEARAAGLALLTLDTVTESPAERLYRALDWQAAGIIPRYAKWPDGRYCDVTFMFKSIA